MLKFLKKALILIGFFWFSSVFSQNSFNPFKLSTTEWSIALCDDNQPPNYYNQYYKLCGDTQINSINYKKIFSALLPQGPGQPVFSFYGFFRQDSILKCNYLRLQGWNKDSLLMDYNLNIGDTIKRGHYSQINTLGSIILKTDSILIGGNKVKVLYTDTLVNLNCGASPYQGNYYTGSFFVEGFGHFYGVFITQGYFLWESYNCPFEYCDVVGGINVNSGCMGLTSVPQTLTEQNVSFYPNPTFQRITIEPFVNVSGLLVNDIRGNTLIIRSYISTQKKMELDLSEYSPGIYFLILKTPEGTITRKIIKQ